MPGFLHQHQWREKICATDPRTFKEEEEELAVTKVARGSSDPLGRYEPPRVKLN